MRMHYPLRCSALIIAAVLMSSAGLPPTPTSALYGLTTRVASTGSPSQKATDRPAGLALCFEPNDGQLDSSVQFISRRRGYRIEIASGEVRFVVSTPAEVPGKNPEKHDGIVGSGAAILSGRFNPANQVQIRFLGSNTNSNAAGLDPLPGRSNYFAGSDPRKWRRNVTNYARVKYENVYPGIDLVFYGSDGNLEYDLLVSPGADPSAIKLGFGSSSHFRLDEDGDLILDVSSGTLRLHKPTVYTQSRASGASCQLARHERPTQIDSRYVIDQDGAVGFQLGAYDRREPLVVDPMLSFSTFLGGTGDDAGTCVAVDRLGYIYVAGRTTSSDFPVTPRSFQTIWRGTTGYDGDVFVVKLDPTGATVIFATYVGGIDDDLANGIAIDSEGNVCITGTTHSVDFPTTAGLLKSSEYSYREGDPFVAKIAAAGDTLIYSTVLAGSWSEEGTAVAVDGDGNAYVCGTTNSVDFPTTAGAFQTQPTSTHIGSGFPEAFVAKLDPAGRLIYATYLGGSLYEEANSIAVDSTGDAYVAGFTTSPDFPLVNPVQLIQKNADVFLTKLNPTGSALIYSTFFGGSQNETAFGVAVDAAGSAYVTGSTSSPDFPTTDGAFQTSCANCSQQAQITRAFVSKFTPSGGSLAYSTYLGGSDGDSGLAIDVDSSGNCYVAGETSSANFPIANALQRAHGDGPLFKSTDGGASWSILSTGLSASLVRALVSDPLNSSTVYAGTNRGVFKSTDRGATWVPMNAGLITRDVSALAIDSLNSSFLLAGTIGGGVFRTVDGATTWTSTGLKDREIDSVAIRGGGRGTVYAGGTGPNEAQLGVYKSRDQGETWDFFLLPVDTGGRGGTVKAVLPHPSGPSVLFAGASASNTGSEIDGGLYRSTDDGATWTMAVSLNGFDSITPDPADSSRIYLSTFRGGVYRSINGGNSFDRIDAMVSGPIAIDPARPSTIYASAMNRYSVRTGLSKSTDGGQTWNPTGLPDSQTQSLLVDTEKPTTLYAGLKEYFTDLSSDAFITKLNPAGTALVYSTYLGGHSQDSGLGLTVGRSGTVYVAGKTVSSDFPLASPIRAVLCVREALIARLSSAREVAQPMITHAAVVGSALLVLGENFSSGATIVLKGAPRKTTIDEANPVGLLIAEKAGKKIKPGRTVTLQVRNTDGAVSPKFRFIRSPE